MRRVARITWTYVLPVIVLACVGWYFYKKLDQPGLWNANLTPGIGWVLAAALVYLVAYIVWGLYYVILLNDQGAHAPTATGLRAYFISQMGKYVPGKILVIVIRVGMLRGIGITRTAVGIAAMYESLVWVGAGALVGIVLLPDALWQGLQAQAAAQGNDLPNIHRAWLILPVGLAPIGLVGLNRFVNRVNRWRKGADAKQLPRVKLHMVLFGLAFDALGWFILGGCLMLVLAGLQPSAELSADEFWNLVSINGIAYVLGFIAFFMPAGIGVRDMALQLLLAVELQARRNLGDAEANALAALLAVWFRLLGTVAEIVVAGFLYRFAPPADRRALRDETAVSEDPDD
jgi:glycosyltransferase 2 family protein